MDSSRSSALSKRNENKKKGEQFSVKPLCTRVTKQLKIKDFASNPSSGRRKRYGWDAWARRIRYLGVSFNNLLVAGVLGLILAVPLSVIT
jgi:hypothetical protein